MDSKMNTRKNLMICFMLSFFLVALLANPAKAAEHNLTFAVPGVVASVKVKIGDRVKVGTVLAVLDLTPFNAVKRSTVAASALAKLILNFSEVRRNQAQEMFDALSTSGEELEKAEIEYARALSSYQNARSQDEIATWRFQHATLKAPFPGTISAIPGYPGKIINTSAGNQTVVVVKK